MCFDTAHSPLIVYDLIDTSEYIESSLTGQWQMDQIWQATQRPWLDGGNVVICQIQGLEAGQSYDQVRRYGPQVVVAQIQL